MKYILIAVLLFACAGCAKKADSKPKPDFTCNVIHKPAQGCPVGYAEETGPRFTEKDGSHEFACLDQTGSKKLCIDELKPGEDVDVIINLERSDEDHPKI